MRTLPQAARIYIFGAVCAAACCAAPALASAPAAVLGPDADLLPAPPGAAPWLPTVLLALGYAGCQLAGRAAGPVDTAVAHPGSPAAVGSTGPAAADSGSPAAPPGPAAALVPVPLWCSAALFAGAFLLPPAAAALVPAAGALVLRGAVQGPAGGPALASRSWRVARLALAAGASAAAFRALDGPAAVAAADLLPALPGTLCAALVCALTLTCLDGGALRAVGRRPPAGWWRGAAGFGAVQLLLALVGLVMAVLWRSPYGPSAALLVLVPIGAACRGPAPWPREHAARQLAVRALVQAMDLKDRYTRRHGERVGQASVLIARELGMAADRQEVLRVAGVLHDVGKLAVPTRVLRKNGPLTPQERQVIELHPEQGDAVAHGIGCLGEARSAILHHHERLDGSGYPHGLAGGEIPEVARVVAVADAFDAMTSTRSYRRARPVSVAVEELRRCAGSQFDPRMVGALVRALDRHGWQPESVEEVDEAGQEAIAAGAYGDAAGAAYGEGSRTARPSRTGAGHGVYGDGGGAPYGVAGAAGAAGAATFGAPSAAVRGVLPAAAYDRRAAGAARGRDRAAAGGGCPGASCGGACHAAYGTACVDLCGDGAEQPPAARAAQTGPNRSDPERAAAARRLWAGLLRLRLGQRAAAPVRTTEGDRYGRAPAREDERTGRREPARGGARPGRRGAERPEQTARSGRSEQRAPVAGDEHTGRGQGLVAGRGVTSGAGVLVPREAAGRSGRGAPRGAAGGSGRAGRSQTAGGSGTGAPRDEPVGAGGAGQQDAVTGGARTARGGPGGAPTGRPGHRGPAAGTDRASR
ncbi:HD-GYP domain-containing protein [Streptomyces sp. 796.1]|uniref:HD-GYP domain-containing protein n=1 Tax=Streptomyces sp. 796.1 TaxID=3163029 RepID=UPI0039C8EA3F